MTIKIQQIVTALLLITAMSMNAQVLWSDDFDSYTIGNLSNDPTGQTLGQGNWHVKIEEFEVQVLPEPGRGNVLAFGWMTAHQTKITANRISKNGFSTLWNNRTPGNDVLKLEYDFYSDINSINNISININTYPMGGGPVVYLFNRSTFCDVCFISGSGGNTSHSIEYDFSWTKIEIYLDYDKGTNSTYAFIRIPSLGFLHVQSIPYEFHQNVESLQIMLSKNAAIYSSVFAKFDNFKLTALPARPSYLNVNEFVSSKFNIFPNPVTDMVTITNSENIGIEQIEVFDISGKTVKSLRFNNENEVQLNIADFASGTYLLYIQTNEGMAVKKVVKK